MNEFRVFIEAKDDEVVVTHANWSYKSCKAPVKWSPPTNQQPVFFYRPDALRVTQPTVSNHWMEKYHIPWTCLPQACLGVFQLCDH